MSEMSERLRKELDLLDGLRAKILACSAPLRAERDRIVNEARAKENELNARIKEIEADLFQIDTDRALLARALGGRRMSDAQNIH